MDSTLFLVKNSYMPDSNTGTGSFAFIYFCLDAKVAKDQGLNVPDSTINFKNDQSVKQNDQVFLFVRKI